VVYTRVISLRAGSTGEDENRSARTSFPFLPHHHHHIPVVFRNPFTTLAVPPPIPRRYSPTSVKRPARPFLIIIADSRILIPVIRRTFLSAGRRKNKRSSGKRARRFFSLSPFPLLSDAPRRSLIKPRPLKLSSRPKLARPSSARLTTTRPAGRVREVHPTTNVYARNTLVPCSQKVRA